MGRWIFVAMVDTVAWQNQISLKHIDIVHVIRLSWNGAPMALASALSLQDKSTAQMIRSIEPMRMQ